MGEEGWLGDWGFVQWVGEGGHKGVCRSLNPWSTFRPQQHRLDSEFLGEQREWKKNKGEMEIS